MPFPATSSFRSLPSHLATSILLNSNSAKLQSPILMSLPQNRSSFPRHLNRSISKAPPNSSAVIRPILTVRASTKTPSPAADTKLIAISSAVTIAFAVANRVLYKLALVPMKEYPFFLAQFTTFGYVVIYFSILFIRYRAGIVINEMLGLPKSRFAAIGMLEAIGVASGMASAAVLPGPAIPILNQTFLVWQLVFSAVLLGRRYSFYQIGGCLLVAVGVIVAVTSGSDTGQMLSGIELMWPGVMIASAAFQAGASIIKEFIFVDAAKRLNAKSLDIFVVNSFGSGFQALFVLLLMPLLSNLKGIPFMELPSYLKSGAACFLKLGGETSGCEGAPLLPLLYIATNMAFNISVLNLLKVSSAIVASLAVTLSVPISIYILSLPLPYLPDGASLSPFFLFGSLILMSGLVVYNIAQPSKEGSKSG
ncbi:CRT (chloroquine-resistance transporter)-like transporter 2 [Hibiscus trionum]|uniref:CRT (Chloroquine-resistance transporter)-like transporter 2 n=1 Tax=Hibiscus trionum TaxID=183268 RepID=A0A9W7M5T5_HIBTR|nr:CRT (chloroquine-resistance transporter)-like transporter 2 [Hibiscus trionum]